MAEQDDWTYLIILLVSIILSFVVKKVKGHREVACAAVGLCLVTFVCRSQVYFSLSIIAFNILLINCVHRRTHLASFVLCFAYLTMFRCWHWFGFERPSPFANAVQLITTLRCVGLALEVQEERTTRNSNLNFASRSLEQFCYCYNFIGIFTGPFYLKRTHDDMCRSEKLDKIVFGPLLAQRLLPVPIYITLLYIFRSIFPIEELKNEEFFENHSCIGRLAWMAPIFLQLRMRCYIAWSLSEAAFIVAGLGAYPKNANSVCGHGPKVTHYERKGSDFDIAAEEYDYETIANIDAVGCELAPTFRQAMRCWNKTVQFWLFTNVYKRSHPAIRTPLTMFVSAIWHGVHAGYFFSFLTIPLCLWAEKEVFSTLGEKFHHTDLSNGKGVFSVTWWFFRMRSFEYMSAGFLLLDWNLILPYWSSVYFALHVVLIVLICLFRSVKLIYKHKSS